ncbi:hypothetical protein pEaSNUABM25_00259 [Erwinia phage pEa_SNUABM_25]|nr:hypothetical protein pEaSNUABM25_00259 [Erwinia phage pEa_SNUABM_25]
MKRRVILIEQSEFTGDPLVFPTAFNFTGIDVVVLVTVTHQDFGGVKFHDTYRVNEMRVSEHTDPLRQEIEIVEYSKLPNKEEDFQALLAVDYFDEEIAERDLRLYDTPTTIVTA